MQPPRPAYHFLPLDTADRDQPPFDRVMMDGIAIRYAEFGDGRRKFPIQSRQHAGDPAQTIQAGKCIEIMTGACC